MAPLTHIGSTAGQTVFVATGQGLVTHNANGDVVPGLAQRWIVMDDGGSYIFRLRRAQWANGDRVDAKDVKRLIEARLKVAAREDPYGSLASVAEVMAMTGDVLEIRLQAPRPNFLMALAEPEMGIAQKDGGSGPYRKAVNRDGSGTLLLTPADYLRDPEDPERPSDRRIVRAERAAKAIVRFREGDSDLVLGGTLADLPYLTLTEIDDNAVRFDPVQGLFGLAMTSSNPMFDDPHVREALSMAIEREAIIGYFAVSRWKIADRILPQQYNLPRPPSGPGWSGRPIEERRNLAIGIIARWQAQHGGKPVELTVELPKGPGMDLLFLALKLQYKMVGVELKRVDRRGDLRLIDEVAPYDSAAWYLSRLSCVRGLHCSKEAEDLLKLSMTTESMSDRLELLGQAEPLMVAHGGYIPLAMPVRWSLVAPRLKGFVPSPRGFHNLRWLLR